MTYAHRLTQKTLTLLADNAGIVPTKIMQIVSKSYAHLIYLFLFIAFAVVLGGCATETTANPADTVIQYMQAKVNGDRDTLAGLLCADLESTLTREAQSFATVDATLENATCEHNGDTDIVTCSGAIVADYGSENTEFPLTSYRVVQEDGVWKWCGEGE